MSDSVRKPKTLDTTSVLTEKDIRAAYKHYVPLTENVRYPIATLHIVKNNLEKRYLLEAKHKHS
jgi:hypothetical protein